MKSKYIKHLILFSLMFICTKGNALEFEIDGLKYRTLPDNEVEVSKGSKTSGTLTIPESVTYNDITYSVTSIGTGAFSGCSGFAGSLTIPNSVSSIENYAFYQCSGFTGSLTIPNSVTSIGSYAFEGCSGFTGSLTIPNSVTSIGTSAFSVCSGFTGSLTIPNSVTSIGNGAFSGCSGFTGSLTIPNSVTSIGGGAFFCCSGFTGSLTLSNSVISIGRWAFRDCSGFTGSLNIPNSVTSIEKEAFWNCSGFTGSLILSNSVTSIEQSVFYGCSGFTGSLTIPNSVTSIGDYAFEGCSGFTGSLTIPNSVTSIGNGAFRFCSGFTGSLTIPNSVTSIGNGAFSICSGFTELTISNSVKTIENSAFSNCQKLSVVYSEIKEPFIIDTSVFHVISSETTLHIPKGTMGKYEQFSGWTDHFKEFIEDKGSASNTFSLSMKSTGNGSILYKNITTKNKKRTFVLDAGESATINFSSDDGYRIKDAKLNNTDITSQVLSNNQYTISKISENTTLDVEFGRAYTLTIKSTGNGVTTYNGSNIREQSSTFPVTEGTSAVVSFTPDAGYRIKKVKLGYSDVTASVTNNQYTISNFNSNTTLEVEYERITYTLSIRATGNGSVMYDNTSTRGRTNTFNVVEGSDVTLTITADTDNRIKSVKVDSEDVTSSVKDGKYTINSISANTNVEVEFETLIPDVNSELYGLKYYFESSSEVYVVGKSDDRTVVVIPEKVSSNGKIYYVIGITEEAFKGCSEILSLSIPGSIKFIGKDAFSGCSHLNKVIAPDISAWCSIEFEKCDDSDSNPLGISHHLYKDENTEYIDVTLPESVIKISSYAFWGCEGITKLEIPNSTQSIGEGAFGSCSNLKSVVLGTDITKLSNYAFKDCVKLDYVESKIAVPFSLGISAFGNISSNAVLKVPDGTRNEYINKKWDIYFSKILEDGSVINTLSIKSSGNGEVSYGGNSIRNNTKSFEVIEGDPVTISISPDNGYRIKEVLRNGTDVTALVVNNKYTINSINGNTYLEVVFEAIPITYSLSITASGNGSVTYSGISVKNQTQTFSITEGTGVTISFTPDTDCRIKSVKVNNTDVTSSVSNNQYIINSITANTTIEVVFEAITYTLSISSTGNGVAIYNSTEVRGTAKTFTVNHGSSAIISFSPDDGNSLSNVMVNNSDVTSQVTSNRYAISDIKANTTLSVTFVEDITAVTVEGVNYKVVSQSDKTVNLVGGDYGQVLTVPTSVSSNEKTWTVVGVEQDALKDNIELAAIIWNPEVEFNGVVSNPNLLLYVKNKQYAPNTIKNVVVNGEAEEITLVDAQSGNNFYCPQAFTAKKVSYEHRYGMTTGYNTCQGWETIVLPFDVATILNATAQEIVPYAIWDESSNLRTFWLYNLTASGWQAVNSIKANTPYIISMPNNENYDASYNITGNIQFIGNNVQIKASDNLSAVQSGNKSFVPNYQYQETSSSIYALNVNNQWNTNTSAEAEGSTFIRSLRAVRPFEAYLTVEGGTSAPNYIPLFGDGMPTGIDAKLVNSEEVNSEKWYSLDGRKLQGKPTTKGLYIVNGRKVVVK